MSASPTLSVRAQPLSARNLLATIVTGYIPLILATLIVALPLLWMVLSSFKPLNEIISTELSVLPREWSPENYVTATTTVPFLQFFANSTIVTVISTVLKTALAITTAYALVFIEIPGRKFIFVAILVALMVPPQVTLLPNFILIQGLGWADTYQGIILPGLGTAFGTFLLRQHFKSLPVSLLESAEIDGASHWRRLRSIVVPISTPTIATVVLVTAVNEWNEYLWPLIITSSAEMRTLPVGLTLLQNTDSGIQNWGVLMAGAVIVILPILIIFAALQRYIVAGLTQGSVTG